MRILTVIFIFPTYHLHVTFVTAPGNQIFIQGFFHRTTWFIDMQTIIELTMTLQFKKFSKVIPDFRLFHIYNTESLDSRAYR